MLDVYFKNVHQGDSVVVEWKVGEELKVGLVDCTLCEFGTNPVLDHLKLKPDLKEIEFIIMSHPHTDHYSGLGEVFRYCEELGVTINKFVFTSPLNYKFLDHYKKNKARTIKLLTSSVNRRLDKLNLLYIYDVIVSNIKNSRIINSVVFSCNTKTPIYHDDSGINIYSVLPTMNQIMEYSSANRKFEKESQQTFESKNNSHANILSTLVVLKYENSLILLCSDVEKHAIDHVLDEILTDENEIIHLFQVPHHGSKHNFNKESMKKVDLSQAYCIISAGRRYGHPNKDVVAYYERNSKGVHCTNYVNGFQEYHSETQPHQVSDLYHGAILPKSFLYEDKKFDCGEKRFRLDDSKCSVSTIY